MLGEWSVHSPFHTCTVMNMAALPLHACMLFKGTTLELALHGCGTSVVVLPLCSAITSVCQVFLVNVN